MILSSGGVPVLETARLVLRAPEGRDADVLFAIHSDPETMRYWNGPPMAHRDEANVLIDRARVTAAAGTAYRWVLERRGERGPEVIGLCGLSALSYEHRRAEIGYVLDRAQWGHGWMLEALEAVLAHGFETLELHRIEAELDPRNEASARILTRLGFVREGVLRERWCVEGEVSDSMYMGLLRPEWQARRQA